MRELGASKPPAGSIAAASLADVVPARWVVPVGSVLVAAYASLRIADAPGQVLLLWSAVAVGAALLSPTLGSLVLVAVAPFTEAVHDDGTVGATPLLVAALAVGVGTRITLARRWPSRSRPIVLVLALAFVTALATAHTALRFGNAAALDAARFWAVGPFAAATCVLVAAHIARAGDRRPLVVVVASTALAAAFSSVAYLAPGALEATPFGALLDPTTEGYRLSGVIAAPNAAATLFLAGAAVAFAAALFARGGGRASAFAWVAAGLMVAGTALTLSRSAVLAGVAGAVAFAARRGRRTALIVLALGALAFVATATVYLALRPDAGAGALPGPSTRGDIDRIAGWAAAARMFLDAPLLGQGFHAFGLVHDAFGTRIVAPHNEWLRLFAEGGIVAGALGLAFLGAALVRLWRTPGWVALGALAALLAFAVMASFNNPLTYVQVVVPVFWIVGAGLGTLGSPGSLAELAAEAVARPPTDAGGGPSTARGPD